MVARLTDPGGSNKPAQGLSLAMVLRARARGRQRSGVPPPTNGREATLPTSAVIGCTPEGGGGGWASRRVSFSSSCREWRCEASEQRRPVGHLDGLSLREGDATRRDGSRAVAALEPHHSWRRSQKGPGWAPVPHGPDGCAPPGVPAAGGRQAPADGPGPPRVLGFAHRAALRLWLLRQSPAVRAVSDPLPAGARQEPDGEGGTRGGRARDRGSGRGQGACGRDSVKERTRAREDVPAAGATLGRHL